MRQERKQGVLENGTEEKKGCENRKRKQRRRKEKREGKGRKRGDETGKVAGDDRK